MKMSMKRIHRLHAVSNAVLLLVLGLMGCPAPNPMYCDTDTPCPQGLVCQMPAQTCAPMDVGGDGSSDPRLDGAGAPADGSTQPGADLGQPALSILGYGVRTIGDCLPDENVSGPPEFYEKIDAQLNGCEAGCSCPARTPCAACPTCCTSRRPVSMAAPSWPVCAKCPTGTPPSP